MPKPESGRFGAVSCPFLIFGFRYFLRHSSFELRHSPASSLLKTRLLSLLPTLIATSLRVLGWTWRIRLDDKAGLTAVSDKPLPPVIWMLWHNRLMVIPVLYQRLFRHRKGAALISRSKDGELLANCIRRFGGEAVRGSSSRGGASALGQLRKMIEDGYDIYITPDGPRGPRYNLSPGAIWLSQSSGTPIMRVSIEYSSFWRLGRWDGFVIPKPFARIDVTLHPLYVVRDEAVSGGMEAECAHLRELMMDGTTLR